MSGNAGEHRHTNALIHETSPYLLQHAHNPVDWFPWGDAALEKARREDKPIFLSIGYSACHWCHVMERESFEHEQIAQYLNEHFVSIKVDREERPDLDDIYMAAVIALNGHGGWPMSVFLTPALRPFYGGTYFPPNDRHGTPGFYRLLHGIHEAWVNRRDEVEQNAEGLTQYVSVQLSAVMPEGEGEPDYAAILDAAVRDMHAQFDTVWGGWGDAPKFPSGMGIGLLLREHHRTGNVEALHMATHTLDRMAAGGIYDHLGGGFARYSVDAEWLVPHFEKMLYDNAQLAQACLEAFQATGNPRYAQVARETLDYVLRDMRDPSGAFHSAEDADSEGEEGRFYLWRRAEIAQLLGDDDAALFCRYYGVHERGNFHSHEPYHQGQNILYLAQDPAQTARQLGLSVEALEQRMAPLRRRLFEQRATRVRPGRDDKILTSWNGLMISALCLGARVLHEPRYREAAVAAGDFFRNHMWREGTLLRTHRRGESRLPGYLDDHAFLANACVDLYETAFDVAWLEEAEQLAQLITAKFYDAESGRFYFTAQEHQHRIVRARPSHDAAEPAGNSMAVLLLLRLAALQAREDYATIARRVLRGCAPLMERAPRGYLKLLWGANWLANPPKEIAIVGPETSAAPLLEALNGIFLPNRVVACGEDGGENVALLEGKTAAHGQALAYVCRNRTCERPVATPQELLAALTSR
jgi:uncharacterized protein YyaL (SSP411 family)